MKKVIKDHLFDTDKAKLIDNNQKLLDKKFDVKEIMKGWKDVNKGKTIPERIPTKNTRESFMQGKNGRYFLFTEILVIKNGKDIDYEDMYIIDCSVHPEQNSEFEYVPYWGEIAQWYDVNDMLDVFLDKFGSNIKEA